MTVLFPWKIRANNPTPLDCVPNGGALIQARKGNHLTRAHLLLAALPRALQLVVLQRALRLVVLLPPPMALPRPLQLVANTSKCFEKSLHKALEPPEAQAPEAEAPEAEAEAPEEEPLEVEALATEAAALEVEALEVEALAVVALEVDLLDPVANLATPSTMKLLSSPTRRPTKSSLIRDLMPPPRIDAAPTLAFLDLRMLPPSSMSPQEQCALTA